MRRERSVPPGRDRPGAREALASKVPYVVDIIVQEQADCSMGNAINSVREF